MQKREQLNINWTFILLCNRNVELAYSLHVAMTMDVMEKVSLLPFTFIAFSARFSLSETLLSAFHFLSFKWNWFGKKETKKIR